MRSAALATLALGAALSGCADLESPPPSQASAAKQADCRQRADEVYAKQNRADLYRSDTYATSQLDSPYSNSGLPGVTTRGLSGQYERDTMVSDCLDDAAGNVGSNAAEPPNPSLASPSLAPASLAPASLAPASLAPAKAQAAP